MECLGPSTIGGTQIDFLTTGLVPYQWPAMPPGGVAAVAWPAPVDADSLVGPTMGDHAFASMDVDLQGMTLEAYVKSTTQVMVVLKNNTGSTITLGLANIRVSTLSFLTTS